MVDGIKSRGRRGWVLRLAISNLMDRGPTRGQVGGDWCGKSNEKEEVYIIIL